MLRLKTRPQFQAAMNGGIIARTQHFALHRLVLKSDALALSAPQPLPHAPGAAPLFVFDAVSLGAMTPKRWAKRAVTRNAIKRQIYAFSAGIEHRMCSAAHVVRLRAAFDRKEFVSANSCQLRQAVQSELSRLFATAYPVNTAEPKAKA